MVGYFFDGHHFYAVRWKQSGSRRECLFCGLKQKQVTKRRVVIDKVWVKA